jgi:hypothetical protein
MNDEEMDKLLAKKMEPFISRLKTVEKSTSQNKETIADVKDTLGKVDRDLNKAEHKIEMSALEDRQHSIVISRLDGRAFISRF